MFPKISFGLPTSCFHTFKSKTYDENRNTNFLLSIFHKHFSDSIVNGLKVMALALLLLKKLKQQQNTYKPNSKCLCLINCYSL